MPLGVRGGVSIPHPAHNLIPGWPRAGKDLKLTVRRTGQTRLVRRGAPLKITFLRVDSVRHASCELGRRAAMDERWMDRCPRCGSDP